MDTREMPLPGEAVVLIATQQGAALCVNRNGATRLIRTMRYGEYGAETMDCRRRAALASELIAMLECSTIRPARFDKVIVLAAEPLYQDLCRLRSFRCCDFLISQIGPEEFLDLDPTFLFGAEPGARGRSFRSSMNSSNRVRIQ